MITSAEEIFGDLQEGLRLEQNYPNPFSSTTTIHFAIPVKSKVLVKIYDSHGIEVNTLVNERLSAGNYKTEFNASDLPAGIYYCTIQMENITKTIKLNISK